MHALEKMNAITCKHIAAVPAILGSMFVLASGIANAQTPTDEQTAKKWSTFKYPDIVIVDKDEGNTRGSTLVHELIPDLEPFLRDIALGVCQKLYNSPHEVPVFEELTFELEHRDGVAGKSGHPPKIRINLSTKYLEGQHEKLGDKAITYEIAGVNWHELTHAYQHVPKNAGSYRSGTEHFGFIEGTADAVRILAGYHETRKPRPGGHWTSGYTTTGFFIVWLAENRDPDFLYKLNRSCKTIDPWNWDRACKTIFGEEASIERLWDEYQHHLKGGGKEAVAKFDSGLGLVCRGQSIRFRNTSFNSPTSYAWTFEGGTPAKSTETETEVTYHQPGRYDVVLVAENEHGKTTERVEECIHVLDRKGKVVRLTDLGGEISHDSETSAMRGEGVENLLDGDPQTKFCLKSNKTRIQYVSPGNYVLYSYAFTSANDAPGRDPEKWALQASNDGSKWTEIDQREEQLFRKRHETRRYVVDSRIPYRFYRWNLEARSDPIFQIADIELLGVSEE
jgi:hypothetical protein